MIEFKNAFELDGINPNLIQNVTIHSNTRTSFEFTNRNSKGEKIVVSLLRCIAEPKDKHSLAYLWWKYGKTEKILTDYVMCEVSATEEDGTCWGRYNPQITYIHSFDEKGRAATQATLNFEWLIEYSEEGIHRLVMEIYRQAFES